MNFQDNCLMNEWLQEGYPAAPDHVLMTVSRIKQSRMDEQAFPKGSKKESAKMRNAEMDNAILRFFRDDIGGILITDREGNILYHDDRTAFVREGKTNWKAACPAPAVGQKAETWDLMNSDTGRSYMVTTSTFDDGGIKQIHHLMDTSVYTGLYREMSDYSRTLRNERDRDRLTGLYNKGKFMEMKRTVFRKQDTIAVFNMDVNNLKQMNDHFGHEAGDRLIQKAAESLKKNENRNVMAFRTGGDEFVAVALHVNRKRAEEIRAEWETGLAELNREKDGIECVIACGFAYGDQGFSLEDVFIQADERMYEDKKAKKMRAGQSMR